MRISPRRETQFASEQTKGSEHIWWGCEPTCPWHAEQLFMSITVWHRGTLAMHTTDCEEYIIAAVQHDTELIVRSRSGAMRDLHSKNIEAMLSGPVLELRMCRMLGA
jgi:hypothetical protein